MMNIESEETEFFSKAFKELDLAGKDFSGKEFEDCQFSDCNFSDATLRSCKFIECFFTRCNLSNVKVPYTRFTDVVFDECKVIGVDWTRAAWSNFDLPSPFQFKQCILNDCSFYALKQAEIVIEGCKAHDVDFREGTFTEANFSYTDFTNSVFQTTNLSRADFTEATAYNIDIHANMIKGAKFSSHEAVSLLNSLEIILVD